jgi:hypothetical protein
MPSPDVLTPPQRPSRRAGGRAPALCREPCRSRRSSCPSPAVLRQPWPGSERTRWPDQQPLPAVLRQREPAQSGPGLLGSAQVASGAPSWPGYRKPYLDARGGLTQAPSCYTMPPSQPEMPGQQTHATAIALPTPRPVPRRCPLARRESTSRSITRSTSALAEFHALADHAGPADGCQDCAAKLAQQRQAAAALRTHQCQARQHVDAILGRR